MSSMFTCSFEVESEKKGTLAVGVLAEQVYFICRRPADDVIVRVRIYSDCIHMWFAERNGFLMCQNWRRNQHVTVELKMSEKIGNVYIEIEVCICGHITIFRCSRRSRTNFHSFSSQIIIIFLPEVNPIDTKTT